MDDIEFSVGDLVIANCDIWDDGQDHHPPGWLAKRGERLYVREVRKSAIAVSHSGVTNSSFFVEPHEIRQG